MSVTNEAENDVAARVVVITRVFDAPRELVFEAWTSPEHVGRWWGPAGFTSTIQEMDVRPGGTFRLIMHGPDGTDYPNLIVFSEVVRPERLVYWHGDDNDPRQFHVTVTFEEEGGRTSLTLRSLFPTAAARDRVVEQHNAIEGGKQHLARLAEHLTTMGEFVLTRVFDAPRELVYRAWTDEQHLMQWWGPKGFAVQHCTNDLRPGGLMHYGLRGAGGAMMWGRWQYREVTPPERLVFVSSFSNEQGDVAPPPFPGWPTEILSTVTLTEEDGRTTVVLRAIPINATEAERATFEGGRSSMKMGWGGTLDQLEAHLAAQG